MNWSIPGLESHTMPDGSVDGGLQTEVSMDWISVAVSVVAVGDTRSADWTPVGSCSRVTSVTPSSLATKRFWFSGESVPSVLGAKVIDVGEVISTAEAS